MSPLTLVDDRPPVMPRSLTMFVVGNETPFRQKEAVGLVLFLVNLKNTAFFNRQQYCNCHVLAHSSMHSIAELKLLTSISVAKTAYNFKSSANFFTVTLYSDNTSASSLLWSSAPVFCTVKLDCGKRCSLKQNRAVCDVSIAVMVNFASCIILFQKKQSLGVDHLIDNSSTKPVVWPMRVLLFYCSYVVQRKDIQGGPKSKPLPNHKKLC